MIYFAVSLIQACSRSINEKWCRKYTQYILLTYVLWVVPVILLFFTTEAFLLSYVLLPTWILSLNVVPSLVSGTLHCCISL